MSNPARIRRLQNDFKVLMNISRKSRFISIESKEGNPTYKYLITYNVPGYINQSGSVGDVHQVEMLLPEGYPIQEPPSFHFRNELWHPNVFPGGDVCLGLTGKNWTFGYDIDQLIYDIGNMIRFSPDSYNLDSPAQTVISKDGWLAWIRRHDIPLANIDFNVSDVPIVKIVERKKIDIKIKNPEKKSIKIKVKEINE